MKQTTPAVANYFLEKAKESGDSLSPMKLQKLIYFAHGWHLAIHGEPLIDEQVQAWQWGPVIQSIYHEFKKYGNGRIDFPCIDVHSDEDWSVPAVDDPETKALLDRVWELYGHLTPVQLSNMTHLPGTPWDQIKQRFSGSIPRHTFIDDKDIGRYFAEKAKASRA